MRKVTIPVEVEIGTVYEIGISLGIEWINATKDKREYTLTCGAGVGNARLQASAVEAGRPEGAYAKASIAEFAKAVFAALDEELDKKEGSKE
jgi:hypothetical protein